eukprot:3551008-Prymnesium_polylepis.1
MRSPCLPAPRPSRRMPRAHRGRPSRRARDKRRVAVREVAVARADGVRVHAARLRRAAHQRGDEAHERRVWRVEVGHEPVAQRKRVARRDAERRGA